MPVEPIYICINCSKNIQDCKCLCDVCLNKIFTCECCYDQFIKIIKIRDDEKNNGNRNKLKG